MRKALYTAIFNNKDTIKINQFINDDYEYILFTDRETLSCEAQRKRLSHSNWKVVLIDDIESPRYLARNLKINPESYRYNMYLHGFDSTIWVDGSFEQIGDLKEIEDFGKLDFAIMKHPVKKCLYMEALACIENKLDDEEKIKQQISNYTEIGYPKDNGLVSSGIIYRRNTESVRKINEAWWEEVRKGSVRDQLSFNYVIWKLKVEVDIFTREHGDKIFRQYPHIPIPNNQ